VYSDPIIQRFDENPAGRDFVVGDIHGCFKQLTATLKQHKFNPNCDRLFSVGDIIDRGPESHEAIQWLSQPWFHACLGNHEQYLLELDPDSEEGKRWFGLFGGEWWLTLSAEQRPAFRAAFSQLPHIIEIKCEYGTVGLVHAEVPKGMNWPLFVKMMAAGDNPTQQSSLWGRRRINSLLANKIKGIDQVVCGHSVPKNKQVLKKGNIWFIETGAYLAEEGGKLTVLDIRELFTANKKGS